MERRFDTSPRIEIPSKKATPNAKRWRVAYGFLYSSCARTGVKSFPKKSSTAFCANLLRLRLLKSLTQEQLAEQLDLHARHYQKLERGSITPSFGVLIRLNRALACSWEDLFKDV